MQAQGLCVRGRVGRSIPSLTKGSNTALLKSVAILVLSWTGAAMGTGLSNCPLQCNALSVLMTVL